MYGLYTYIYHKLWLNVGKYTIHWAYGTPPIKHIITECSPTLLSAVTKRDRACSAPPRAWQVDTQMPKNVAIVRGTLWFNLTHEPQKHGSVLLTNPNIPNNTFLYGKSLNHSSWWFQPNPFEKNDCQIGYILDPRFGVNIKKHIWSCHHPDLNLHVMHDTSMYSATYG